VSRLAVTARCATHCLQTHPIGDLPVKECKYEGWIGRQPWVLFSITGCGIDIILSLNIQQECIHSSIVVEKSTIYDNLRNLIQRILIYGTHLQKRTLKKV
jgi:hypothetical protein